MKYSVGTKLIVRPEEAENYLKYLRERHAQGLHKVLKDIVDNNRMLTVTKDYSNNYWISTYYKFDHKLAVYVEDEYWSELPEDLLMPAVIFEKDSKC